MNRRTALALTTMALSGAALSAGDAMAQQRSLKDQLVGIWTAVSDDFTPANGTKQQRFGANPKGILIFDAGGRYADLGGRPDRPKYKTPGQPTTEERSAAAQGFYANFGTWSVSEADKTLTQHFEGALNPNNEGVDFNSSVSLAGDELKLTSVNPITGTRVESVYRRAR
jgi:hypothetical protein